MLICRALLAFCGILPFLLYDGLLVWIPERERAYIAAVAALVLSVILCACLRMGREAFFFSLAQNGKAKLKTLFLYFAPTRILFAIRCWLTYYAVRTARFAVLFAPFAFSAAAVFLRLRQAGMSYAVLLIDCIRTVVLFAVAAIFLAAFHAGDFLFYRLVLCGDERSPRRAFVRSRQAMQTVLFPAVRFGLRQLAFAPAYLFTLPCIFAYRYTKTCRCLQALDGFAPPKKKNRRYRAKQKVPIQPKSIDEGGNIC